MGSVLPRPVLAAVVERHATDKFQISVAEMNGFRNSMEDAHLIHMTEDFGVFGVFDGHGGGACSEFAARRFREELAKSGVPRTDAAVKKLFIDIDQEFLDSGQQSGSTATMCIVQKPEKPGGKCRLHVINAGDSRVLLGRRDGSIVDGGGTDQGLTVDHKPDAPSERARIERCGGRVEVVEGGVARVNGNLAVSRGFGDREEKETGGPAPEDRPVTVDPEMGHFECDEDDFLLLVCDGVSEGSFPNPEVVKLVAEGLREGKDAGDVARAVCHKAVDTDSKDNITCAIVQLKGAEKTAAKSVEFVPGPIANLGNKDFRSAYTAMAAKASLNMAEACAMRWPLLQERLKADPDSEELKEEAAKIGGPPPDDSKERLRWFESWLDKLPEEKSGGLGGLDMDSLQQLLGKGGPKGGGKGYSSGSGAPVAPFEDNEEA